MLPKERRLSRAEFSSLFASGEKRTAGPFRLIVGEHSPHTKAAVVVPKTTVRRAHERNKLKRAAYRALAHATFSRDTIVIVRAALTPSQLYEALTRALT